MSKEGRHRLIRPLVLAAMLGTGAWMTPGTAADYVTAAGKLPSSAVRKMMEDLRASIHHVQLPDGSTVSPETVEERKIPLVSTEEAKGFVDIGVLSALAKVCGLDWRRTNFGPMLESERATGARLPKALAYIAALHGFGMGLMEDTFRKDGCPDDLRDRTATQIQARWQEAE